MEHPFSLFEKNLNEMAHPNRGQWEHVFWRYRDSLSYQGLYPCTDARRPWEVYGILPVEIRRATGRWLSEHAKPN